jgi:hypothetical protein
MDGAQDVRLGCQMKNEIDACGRPLHHISISNVPVDELNPIERLRKMVEATSLQVVNYDKMPGIFAHQEIHQVAPDEASAACYKDVSQL